MGTTTRTSTLRSLLPAAIGIPIAIVVGMQVGIVQPNPLSLIALSLGFITGITIRLGRERLVWIMLWYSVCSPALHLVFGFPWLVSIATAITAIFAMCLLAFAGWGMGLRHLADPPDVIRLAGVAALAAVLVPSLAGLAAAQFQTPPEFTPGGARAMLAAAAGVIVAGSLPLTYRTPRSWRPGRRTLEFLGLVGVTVALVWTITAYDAQGIVGSGPLFLLVLALGWAAVRFGPFVTSLFLTGVAVWLAAITARGVGLFAEGGEDPLHALLIAQTYLLVTGLGVLMLAVYAQRVRLQDIEAGQSTEILYSALDGAGAQLFLKRHDPDTDRFVYIEANDTLADTLGLQPSDFIGKTAEDLYAPALARRFREQDERVLVTGERLRFDNTLTVDGRTTSHMTTLFPLRDEHGEVVGVGGVSLDRTEEIRRERLLQLVFSHSPVPTARLRWTGNNYGRLLEVNEAFGRLVGLSSDQMVGHHLTDVVTFLDMPAPPVFIGGTAQHEVRVRRHDGMELTVQVTSSLVGADQAGDPFVIALVQDITDARAAQAGLVHRATHDPLTDLFNRQALVERLSHAGQGAGIPRGVALLCCDIDGFKHINDTFGHDTGDRVLLAMAERMRSAAGMDATVARLGADEFVIVTPGLSAQEHGTDLAEHIRRTVAAPLSMDGRRHELQVSIGVAISDGNCGAEELLRQGDVALSRAKDLGRDRVVVYQTALDRRVQMRMAMRETLSKALSENRVEAHLQPVVDLTTGVTVGAEALVRLRDLDGTLLPPAAFIPVAEETGLIAPLGLRVLDIGLALSRRWSDTGIRLGISINVSPRQLSDAALPATVDSLLKTHGVDPDDVTLEVTESSVMDAVGNTLSVLRELRDGGLHIAIDDFGTGYSSLSSLRHMPADIVKIDRSFVSGLGGQDSDEAIVRAVLAMAHATDRIVVAEGVETAQQAARLLELGCDHVQGFLFSPPVPAMDFDPRRRFTVPGVPQSRMSQPNQG